MTDGEVREVPVDVGAAEGLDGALRRGEAVSDQPGHEERKRIAPAHRAAPTLEGQEQVPRPGPHRHHHAHAEEDGRALEPPCFGAEYEMMRADQRVEEEIGPETENARA